MATSRPRIHSGGAFPGSGAMYRSFLLISILHNRSRPPAHTKPTIGDTRSDVPTSEALAQLIPSPKVPALSHELARPTPMIAPISVCELDAGRPRYHVPRFQMMAESSSAKTMANPAPEPTFSTSSTGRSASTPKAIAPEETSTPIRFQHPDQTTATVGFNV